MKAIQYITRSILVSTLMPMAALAAPQEFKWMGVKTSFEEPNQKSLEQSIKSLVLGIDKLSLSDTAQKQLSFSMSKLDRKIILTAEVTDAQAKVEARTVTLNNLDELELAIPRVVIAIIEGVPVRETAARGQIYGTEKHKPSRLRSSSGFQFSLGGAMPLGDAFNQSDMFTTLGIGYLWDIDDFMVEVRSDFAWGDSTNNDSEGMGSLSIGTHYVLWQNRFASIFAGGEFGFGWATAVTPSTEGSYSYNNEDEAHGFMVAADVGTNLLRYADINVDFRLRGTMLTSKIDDHLPFSVGLALGLRY